METSEEIGKRLNWDVDAIRAYAVSLVNDGKDDEQAGIALRVARQLEADLMWWEKQS